ncbi:amidase signature domain-containing protein [Aspergillus filifer]
MVRLLKDAGAVPYAKTALPVTLLSFELTDGLWGICRNPHRLEYSPGGSIGGEAALLTLGDRIGIGSDTAGSVRVPAAWSGIYAIQCSLGRWPKAGVNTRLQVAILVRDFRPRFAAELLKLVAEHEVFRAAWHTWWDAKPPQFHIILSFTNASPALPHRAMRDAISGCGIPFLWNLLDYAAGVVPVSHVHAVQDTLPGRGKKAYKDELRISR